MLGYTKEQKEARKKLWEDINSDIATRHIGERYQDLVKQYQSNSENLKSFDNNWSDEKTVKQQSEYYSNLKKQQEMLKSDIKKYKNTYIANFGEQNYKNLLSNVKQLGKNTKQIQDGINQKGEE